MLPAIIGFVMIAVLIVSLLKFKLLPITFFATVPLIAAALLGFSITEIFKMTALGVIDVLPTAALFVFSITYFGVMSDAGMFDKPVNWMLKRLKPNVFSVLVATIVIAMTSHLDGSGVTTIMITVPAMLPVLEKLKVRKLPMAFMLMMTISVMNLLPWGGPLGRASVVVGVDTPALWRQVIPVQIFGFALLFVTAWIIAKQEERLGYAAQSAAVEVETVSGKENEFARPKLFLANVALTVVVIALLFLGCPAFLPFMIGLAVALPMNYYNLGERGMTKRIAAHAGDVVPMVATIMGAGIFLGVLNDAGIITGMAGAIIKVVPDVLGPVLHVVFAILAIPMSLVLDADSMNLGILPFISQVSLQYNIPEVKTALAIAIGHNTGIGFCMTSASVYFGLGLIGLEYGETLKYSFFKALAFGSCLILFGVLTGVL